MRPYRVEVDTWGCAHCEHGRTWHVVDNDEIAGSVSYENIEDAESESDHKNDAYEKGFQAGAQAARNLTKE